MRAYNQYGEKKNIDNKIRSVPIITQDYRKTNKGIMDRCFKEIQDIIEKNDYKYVMYSSNIEGKIGFQTFNTDGDFQDYLTAKIKNLSIHQPIVCTGLLSNDATIMNEIRKYANIEGIIEKKPYVFTENIKYAK